MRLLRHALLTTCASVGIAAAGLPPAAAFDRSFSINPAGLERDGAATVTLGISLPKSGPGVFWIHFVVPLDHADNTPITVRVYMGKSTIGACTAATRLEVAIRRRVGATLSNSISPNVDGIKPAGGVETTTFPAAPNTIIAKNYIVRKPQAAPFKKLIAGDGVAFQIGRFPTLPSDTCTGPVNVSHIDVRYTSTAAP